MQVCTNALQREKLEEFAKDYEEYHNFVGKYKRGII
jgi:hypothetical protein